MRQAGVGLLVLIACARTTPGLVPTSPSAGAADSGMEWLVGTWTACGSDQRTTEVWELQDGVIVGTNVSITDSARSEETMRIERDGGGWVYEAVPDGQPAHRFVGVSVGASYAVFEDPEHDYPQRIRYRRDGDRLTARIEAMDGTSPSTWEFSLGTGPCPASPS